MPTYLEGWVSVSTIDIPLIGRDNMADLLPKFKVTDPHFRAGTPQERRDTGKLSNKGEGKARTVSL